MGTKRTCALQAEKRDNRVGMLDGKECSYLERSEGPIGYIKRREDQGIKSEKIKKKKEPPKAA